MRLLLVEKCAASARLHAAICADGAVVTCTETVEEAAELLRHETYDLILLNISSQSQDGFNLIRWLRKSRNDTPLVALTGAQVANRIKALGLGADDAIADPVDLSELQARVTAVVRRSRGFSQSLLHVGDLSLCLASREVWFRGAHIRMTEKEYSILELMVLRKGATVTKNTFLNHLYSGLDEPEVKIIDVFICKLRKKLRVAGLDNLIHTDWGHGYSIREPEATKPRSNHATMQGYPDALAA